jgi:hypothetical protein
MPASFETIASLIYELRETGGDWQTAAVGPDALDVLQRSVLPQLGDDVAEAIASKRLAYASPDELIYPTSEAQAAALWKSGKTAILQNLQMKRGVVNAVAATLEVLSHRRISCSAYLSGPRAQSFDFHTDEWDAFIIQLQGDKVFDLQPATAEQVAIALSPGDVLYMPQGLRHVAHSETGSLHISINFLPFPPRVAK